MVFDLLNNTSQQELYPDVWVDHANGKFPGCCLCQSQGLSKSVHGS